MEGNSITQGCFGNPSLKAQDPFKSISAGPSGHETAVFQLGLNKVSSVKHLLIGPLLCAGPPCHQGDRAEPVYSPCLQGADRLQGGGQLINSNYKYRECYQWESAFQFFLRLSPERVTSVHGVHNTAQMDI